MLVHRKVVALPVQKIAPVIRRRPSCSSLIPNSLSSQQTATDRQEALCTPGATATRPLKAEEKAQGLVARPYARTAIVIAVHPSVKDETLSPHDLVAIIKGEKKTWQDGSQIIVQAREDAIRLVEVDPELTTHPQLSAAVQRLADEDKAAFLERG